MTIKNKAFSVNRLGVGPPVLLIPGLNSSGELWEETVKNLSPFYECHVFTLAGFAGEPSVEVDNYSKFITEKLVDYIRENELSKPTLIGHSLGGFVSMWTAILLKEEIRGVVVVDITPFLPAIFNPNANRENTGALATGMRKHMEGQSEEQIRYAQEKLLEGITSNQQDFDKALAWGLQSDQNLAAQVMYELYTIDLREEVSNIACPVLVLGSWRMFENYGFSKVQIEDIFKNQYKGMRNVRINIFEEAKHYIMWDEQVGYLNILNQFLSKENK